MGPTKKLKKLTSMKCVALMIKAATVRAQRLRMTWTVALRIATSPSERWLKKAAEWNPELSSRYRTNRAIGRPRKRWEDDVNEFLNQQSEESENPIESSNQTNKT